MPPPNIPQLVTIYQGMTSAFQGFSQSGNFVSMFSPFLPKFSLVGNPSKHAFHANILILAGSLSSHIFFHNGVLQSPVEHSPIQFFQWQGYIVCTFNRECATFISHPNYVVLRQIVAKWDVKYVLASKVRKCFLILSTFHYFVSSQIRDDTIGKSPISCWRKQIL